MCVCVCVCVRECVCVWPRIITKVNFWMVIQGSYCVLEQSIFFILRNAILNASMGVASFIKHEQNTYV